MIFNMVGGGGASGASVFAINSVDERPTNVSDNTLWVNTDIDVTKYIFSNNEPSSPIEGMLWLTTLDDSGVNVVAPINKDWMEFNLGLVRQYIGGAWERKLAQLYKDGVWVNVSKIFAAYINITYPANSTCVVTNSIGQVVASDTNATSSEKTFTVIVGAMDTYTVTATANDDSDDSAEKTVEITAEGQSESVILEYRLVLFAPSVTDKMSIGFADSVPSGLATLTVGDTVKITSQTNGAISYMSNKPINLSDYSVIKCDNIAYSGNGFLIIDTIRDRNCAAEMPVARTTEATFSLDNYTGEYFVGITCFLGGSKEIGGLVIE